MIDIDMLRNMKLIEEIEQYENDFISMEDIIKSEELDYYTSSNYEEYFLEKIECKTSAYEGDFIEDLDLEFEFEDYLLQLRDEQLIEEKENEMKEYYWEIDDEIAEYDPLGAQIEALKYEDIPIFDYLDDDEYFDYEDCFDYEDPIEDYFYFDDYNFEKNRFIEASYCGGNYLDYMPNDDVFIRIEGCDYPEGPNENLGGLKYF